MEMIVSAAPPEANWLHDDSLESCFGRRFWFGDSCPAVNCFRYLSDRLFVISCWLYALNRWCVKPYVPSPFVRGHLNDLLLIPCALPPILLLQRCLNLRANDAMPTSGEIAFHLAIWSLLFEVIGPHLMRHATGDPLDVVAYLVGGVLGWCWWQRQRLFAPARTNEF
jgi:hypothetical protein